MAPLTHLIASWIVAAKTTDNLRDRRLVTLAGVAPDLDGLGMVYDWIHGPVGRDPYFYYHKYHHFLLHGLPAAVAVSVVFAILARRHWRVFWLAMLTFHLHLLCDLAGSRGPDPSDLWPIAYLAPFRQNPIWFWKHQWPLDGWQNWLITMALLTWALWIAIKIGDSFVGVLNHRWDRHFVTVLRKWYIQFAPAKT